MLDRSSAASTGRFSSSFARILIHLEVAMLDLDPRDFDSRDEERHANTPSRGGRGSSGDHDRDHDWRQSDARTRDRDDGDTRSLGRGPGNDRQGSDAEGRDRDHDTSTRRRSTRAWGANGNSNTTFRSIARTNRPRTASWTAGRTSSASSSTTS
jgi:hypothetical protein